MKKVFLDILACPLDKHHPLELHGDGGADPIVRGVLYCTECGRLYVIADGIPVLLPDELRDRDFEVARLKDLDIPPHVRGGLPWKLT